jgi:hypothetical protein
MSERSERIGKTGGEMRSFSVVSMFGTVSLVFLAPVSPCVGETVLSFEP